VVTFLGWNILLRLSRENRSRCSKTAFCIM